MKTTKQDLQDRCARMEREREPLELALSDCVNGNVTWFGRSPFRLGICRPNGAAGGIVIVNTHGMVSADYWEQFARNQMEHIAACITGENTEANRELMARRSTIETAAKFVREMQARAA